MRYIKNFDYETLWYALKQQIYYLSDHLDWMRDVSDDAYEQEKYLHQKEMCNGILELMEKATKNA